MSNTSSKLDQPFMPRYQVAESIGEGAAAQIYRVIDSRDGAIRAIKALRPEANAEPSIVQRFEDEYRILRSMHHPSLPEVYDYGFTDAGIRYIVMDYVKGQPLDEYFRAHPEDLWLLLYELCEVLSFIHNRDLLHLDLKPANILVKRTSAYCDDKPMAVLMDFGLSYRRDVGAELSLVGTPEYMAPEIIRGDERITRAADYYSLGIALYQLLVGKTPFSGAIKDIFSAHLQREIRFREEKTEHAELYPHVSGMVDKDIDRRLGAFEGFKLATTGRLGAAIGDLDRAYALSAITSIGGVGNKDVRSALENWLDGVNKRLSQSPVADDESRDQDSQKPIASDVRERYSSIETELISSVKPRDIPVTSQGGEAGLVPRVFVLGGPSGSGKTHLIDEIITNCRLSGTPIWQLLSTPKAGLHSSETSSAFEDLATADISSNVDPGSVLFDRYANGWELLKSRSDTGNSILVIDDWDELNDELKGFAEYVIKRIAIESSQSGGQQVHVVVATNNARAYTKAVVSIIDKRLVATHSLSSLQADDITELTAGLHASPLTRDDRTDLHSFLSDYSNYAGATIPVLEELSLKGALRIAAGRWSFTPPTDFQPTDHIGALESYCRGIMLELPHDPRKLLEWICCHDGPVSLDILGDVSRLDSEAIASSLDVLHNYKLLDTGAGTNANTVGIAGKSMHEAFHRVLTAKRRAEIHSTYAAEYQSRMSAAGPLDENLDISSARQLAFHYEINREYREMLSIQVRTIRVLAQKRRLIELRSVCQDGISVLYRIDDAAVRGKYRLFQRYFIRRLVDAQWALSDYESIRRSVAGYLKRSKGDLPVRVLLKYCLSLVFAAQYDAAGSVLAPTYDKYEGTATELYYTCLVIDATIASESAELNHAIELLKLIEKHASILSPYGQCRMLTCFVAVYDRLSDDEQLKRYIPALEALSKRHNFTHEYLIAFWARFNLLFARSKLFECKRLVRRATVIANKYKSYYRLVEWRFLASAVYYEEGQYDRAIRRVNEALQQSERLGLVFKIPEYTARLAMNYRNAGLYGNAMIHADRALSMRNRKWGIHEAAVIYLCAAEAHITANSRLAQRSLKRVKVFLDSHPQIKRWGYYWHLQGSYHYSRSEVRPALEAFRKSRLFEEANGAIDDAVRAGLKETLALLDLSEFQEAGHLLRYLGRLGRKLESTNIKAEYQAVTLAYHYRKRSPSQVVKRHISKCGSAARDAREVPILVDIDSIMFRAQARTGDINGAKSTFSNHLKRLKRVLGNMPSKEFAAEFLDVTDEKLLIHEYKTIIRRSRIRLSDRFEIA